MSFLDIAELRQAMTAHGLNPDSILTAASVRNATDLAKQKDKAAGSASNSSTAEQPRGVTFDSDSQDKDRDSDNERDKDDLKPERPKVRIRSIALCLMSY